MRAALRNLDQAACSLMQQAVVVASRPQYPPSLDSRRTLFAGGTQNNTLTSSHTCLLLCKSVTPVGVQVAPDSSTDQQGVQDLQQMRTPVAHKQRLEAAFLAVFNAYKYCVILTMLCCLMITACSCWAGCFQVATWSITFLLVVLFPLFIVTC